MIALAGAVFFASLMGSMHCAGMCGAFVALAVGGDPANNHQATRLHVAYNGGRLITYTLLGAVAGLLGAALDLGGQLLGLQRAAAALAGAMMIGFGAIALLRASGVRIARAPLPPGVRAIVSRGNRFAARRTPFVRAGVIGLLTTLLPCGWLYAFAIVAAGTADPLFGAGAMIAFWAGTLPALIAVGVGAQKLLGPLRSRAPQIAGILLIAVGLFTVFSRASIASMRMDPAIAQPAAAIDRVERIDQATLPCCDVE